MSMPQNTHYNDVIMSTMTSQITSLTIVYSNVYSRQRSKKTPKPRVTGLCEGIQRWPVNSPHKRPVMRKMFSFDDVMMPWIISRHWFGYGLGAIRPRRNGWHFADDIFIYVFFNANHCILIQSLLKFVTMGSAAIKPLSVLKVLAY